MAFGATCEPIGAKGTCTGTEVCVVGGAPCHTGKTSCSGAGLCMTSGPSTCGSAADCGTGQKCCFDWKHLGILCAGECRRDTVCASDSECFSPYSRCKPPWASIPAKLCQPP